MATVQTQQIREERWRETTRMMALQNKDEQTGDQRSGLFEIQDHTSRSTTNNEYEYPQVRKTGVDAVHESCPQMVYII